MSYIYLIFQRFLSPPTIIVTPSHQVPERPGDAIAYWLEEQSESSFKICFREKEIFAGLHQNIKIVSGFRICPIIAINLQPSIETGQDCNGTGGFILAQESNSHNKKNRNPKSHDWSYVELGNSECQSIRKVVFRPGQNRLQGFLRQLKERGDFWEKKKKEIEIAKKNENQ